MEATSAETEKMVEKGTKALQELEARPWAEHMVWNFEENLKYDSKDGESGTESVEAKKICGNPACAQRAALLNGEIEISLLKCARCGALYCSKECQRADWRVRHKLECTLLTSLQKNELSVDQKHFILEEALRRIRIYMCPYAVGFYEVRGRGFVMIKSNSSLAEWIYGHSGMDQYGRELSRYMQLQYLTLGEFDGLAFEDDFELAVIRPSLQKALDDYNPETQVVIVVLLKCGYFTCVTVPIVPDFGMCKSLAAMYEYRKMDGPLRLNIDEKD